MALHEICLPRDLGGTGHVCVRSLLQVQLATKDALRLPRHAGNRIPLGGVGHDVNGGRELQ